MERLFFAILAIGFLISGTGMYSLTYVEHPLNRSRRHMVSTQERRAPLWPLYVAFTCIPLGIAIMFGAIVWKNHLPK
jgi:hypothetical protein